MANELTETELDIIQEAQREEYREEIKRKELCTRSHLLPLTPMLDAGILLANTRLRRSDDPAREIKFPIILPKKHPVTKLIVKYLHELDCHEMGVNYTLSPSGKVPRNLQSSGRGVYQAVTGARDASGYIQLNSRWLRYHSFAWR